MDWLSLFIEMLYDAFKEKVYLRIKRGLDWVTDAPINIESLVMYVAIGSNDKSRFDTLCDNLKGVDGFKVEELSTTNNLTRERGILLTKDLLVFRVYLLNSPSRSSFKDNLTIKIEVAPQIVRYRTGMNNLKHDLNLIVSASKTIFNPKARINYRMKIKNTKHLDIKSNIFKIYVYGDKANIESNDLAHLEKVIAISS